VRRQARILIVDDDALLVSSLSRAAIQAGFAVSTSLDGSHALELCFEEHPDLVLLDVNLPSTDGRDILKKLKTHPVTAGILVFVHSARASQHDRILALELGADDFLEKPFDPTLMFRRIVTAIERRGPLPSG
jgi:DNA-binding response OmpR family regulator